MSPIGRIFSVLNLILAALFLSWASNNLATSHEFKKQLEDEQAARKVEVEELNGRIAQQAAEMDNVKTERDDFRGKASSAEDAKRRADQDNAVLTRQNQELSSTNDKNAETISSFESHIGSLESAKDQAVAAQHDAENQRDDALAGEQEAKTSEEEVKQENARLLDQIRRQAERERLLYEVTSKIRRSADVQTILATTASELTKAIGARHARIKIDTNIETSEPISEK